MRTFVLYCVCQVFNITPHQCVLWHIFHRGMPHFGSIFNMHIITCQRRGTMRRKKDFLLFIGVQLQQRCTDVITPGMSGELFSGQQWICQSWWGSTQETALSNKSNAHWTSILYAFLTETKQKRWTGQT